MPCARLSHRRGEACQWQGQTNRAASEFEVGPAAGLKRGRRCTTVTEHSVHRMVPGKSGGYVWEVAVNTEPKARAPFGLVAPWW